VETPGRLQRGMTMIENMMAMSLLLIGATGGIAINRQSQQFLGDARKITRASAIAGDLATQIELWDFDDPRLANPNPANDLDVGDSALNFQRLDAPPFDHGEADLDAGGRVWTGLPAKNDPILGANGMERYWNVSFDNTDFNTNGVPDCMRIAVIVRWRSEGGWRRIVVPIVKVNPAERM
jgi:prepilin-type N-terminal cleavage/methylation domain-containing protein